MAIPVAAEAPPVTTDGFDELFAREYAPMVRLAFLLVDRTDVAEEVVQDAFARLHERWGSSSNPGGYLRTAVLNGARSVLRRRRLERAVRLRAPSLEPSSDLGADELLDALRVLSPRRRAVVVLRFYEGLSEAEIAAAIGVRPGTVKSMLHRSLAQLREVVER